MKKPLVSICIAAYRADRFLEATLRSIQAQTFHDWELILVEDGSKDRTEEIAGTFMLEVPQNVSYLRHTYNRGVPAARNTAVAAATGEWVAFLDADDLWKPDHLASLISASQIEDCDAVFAGSTQYDNATWTKLGSIDPSDHDLENLPLALYSGHLTIVTSSIMIRRSSLQRFGRFAPEYPHCNDIEYWLRMLHQHGRLLYSGANTCIYRRHDGSLSRQLAELLLESARVCEQYGKWKAIPRPLVRQRIGNLYRWAGRMLLSGNKAAARAPLSRALRAQPLNPKNLGLWLKVYLPL